RLDRRRRLEAGDRLEALLLTGAGIDAVLGRLEHLDLGAVDDVDVVAGLDQEVQAGDTVDLEGDRLLTGLEQAGDADAGPLAEPDRLLADLLAPPDRVERRRGGELRRVG